MMEIVDLTAEHEDIYLCCLEDWSEEIREGGDARRRWYERMRHNGLGVKLAIDDDGTVAGMVQYVPCEYAAIEAQDIYMILCIWVHGHAEGHGDRQGRGMGVALLEAAEADVRARGARGLAAWGLALPVWMKASWFKKHGYKKADRIGIQTLLFKAFEDGVPTPRWLRQQKTPEHVPNKVCLTACQSGWCSALNVTIERAREVAAEFDEMVVDEVDTSDVATMQEWGLSDGLFLDGEPIGFGPPVARDKLRKKFSKRVRKLR